MNGPRSTDSPPLDPVLSPPLWEPRESNALRRIASAGLICADLTQLAPLISAEILTVLDVSAVMIEVVDPATRELVPLHRAAANNYRSLSRQLGFVWPTTEVRLHAKPLVRPVDGGTFVGLPLLARGKIFGVLSYLASCETAVPEPTHPFVGAVLALIQAYFEKSTTEKLLVSREEELRVIYDNVPAIVCLFDEQLRVVRTNQAVTRLSGRSPEQVIGQRAAAVLGCLVRPEEPEACGPGCGGCPALDLLERTLHTGLPIENRELRWIVPQEKTMEARLLLASTRRVRIAGQVRVLLTLQDITYRKEALRGDEAFWEPASEKLVEKRRLDGELYRAQRLESVGAIVSGVAHDLANLLTPVVLGSELLSGAGLAEGDRSSLELVQQGAQRSIQMLKQLLAFVRGGGAEWRPVAVKELLEELQKVMRLCAPTNIRVAEPVIEKECRVGGDALQLHQVLLNLCLNARDAMPQGGTLSMEATLVESVPKCATCAPPSKKGPFVRMRVRDTGLGMSPVIVRRIFDPFYSTKPRGKGTGLGLTTALTIVEAHGGCIEVESVPNHGTVFSVYLPLLTGESDTERLERVGELPRGEGERLVVVEARPEVRLAVSAILRAQGYRVDTVESPGQAQNLSSDGGVRWRAALVDASLVGEDQPSWEQWRGSGLPDAAVTILTLSGAREPAAVESLRGAAHRLIKPFTRAQLLKTVAGILGKA